MLTCLSRGGSLFFSLVLTHCGQSESESQVQAIGHQQRAIPQTQQALELGSNCSAASSLRDLFSHIALDQASGVIFSGSIDWQKMTAIDCSMLVGLSRGMPVFANVAPLPETLKLFPKPQVEIRNYRGPLVNAAQMGEVADWRIDVRSRGPFVAGLFERIRFRAFPMKANASISRLPQLHHEMLAAKANGNYDKQAQTIVTSRPVLQCDDQGCGVN